MDRITTSRQLVRFVRWSCAFYGFKFYKKGLAKRTDVVWRVKIMPGVVIVFDTQRQKSFEAHVLPYKCWVDRLRTIFRMWTEVARLDFLCTQHPILADNRKQLYISLLDLAQLVGLFCGEYYVKVVFPSTLEFVRGKCRLLLHLAPPRANLRCASCDIFLGGPVVKNAKLIPVESMIYFCTRAVLSHRHFFVSQHSAL